MKQTKALILELKQAGITHPMVLKAMENVPREEFTLPTDRSRAYENVALPISCQQTISQPYIVALMTQALYAHPNPQKILEIGTGSGYQSAILAYLFKDVYTIERIKHLYEGALKTFAANNIRNIHSKWDDGLQGWKEYAPYDAIIVTACAESTPSHLIEQLSPNGGVMVFPIEESHGAQKLILMKKEGEHISKTHLEYVSFVPLLAGKSTTIQNDDEEID